MAHLGPHTEVAGNEGRKREKLRPGVLLLLGSRRGRRDSLAQLFIGQFKTQEWELKG